MSISKSFRYLNILHVCLFLLTWLAALLPALAQSRHDPLTDKQIEDVREAGVDPPLRIKLFTGYVDDRATAIQALDKDAHAQYREQRTHDLLDEFTRLSDDLQDNLEEFNEQHADLRKPLKVIVDKSTAWTAILNEPNPSAQYDFVRKSALDANQSLHDTATKMLGDEETYFAEKKKADKEAQKKADRESETR